MRVGERHGPLFASIGIATNAHPHIYQLDDECAEAAQIPSTALRRPRRSSEIMVERSD